MAIDSDPSSMTRRLSSAYLALTRRCDGRAGPFQSLMTRLVDFELRLRPEFRALDRSTRIAVYREYRDLVESDPAAVATAAWSMALLFAGLLAGGVMGIVAAQFAVSRWVPAYRSGSAIVDVAKVVGITCVSVCVGVFLGGLGGLLAAVTRRRGRSSLPDWRAFVAERTHRDHVPPE